MNPKKVYVNFIIELKELAWKGCIQQRCGSGGCAVALAISYFTTDHTD